LLGSSFSGQERINRKRKRKRKSPKRGTKGVEAKGEEQEGGRLRAVRGLRIGIAVAEAKERHKKFFAFQYNDTTRNARAWASALVITEQHTAATVANTLLGGSLESLPLH
jgi:hypothetical protein